MIMFKGDPDPEAKQGFWFLAHVAGSLMVIPLFFAMLFSDYWFDKGVYLKAIAVMTLACWPPYVLAQGIFMMLYKRTFCVGRRYHLMPWEDVAAALLYALAIVLIVSVVPNPIPDSVRLPLKAASERAQRT